MDKAGALHYSSAVHDTKDLSELKPAEEELSQDELAVLEGRVWRKLDTRVLPLCTGFFLLAFLVCLWTWFQARYTQVQEIFRTGPTSRMHVWLACRHH